MINLYDNKTVFDVVLEDRMCYGYIYITTNLVNGKKYIGKKSGKFKPSYYGSGKHIKQALKKYGNHNFVVHILELCNKEDLDDREIYWINLFDAKNSSRFYNLIDTVTPIFVGEENPFYGKTHTEETKEKIRNTWNSISDEIRQERSDAQSEKLKLFYQSEDGIRLKEKQSRERKNRKPTPESIEKCKNTNSLKSEEEKQRINNQVRESLLAFYETEEGLKIKRENSERMSGMVYSQERNKKISETLTGKPHPWQDKVNKNPEKIEKTAQKHRGMKRSEDSKRRMSEASKNKGKPARNKTEQWFHDPTNKVNASFMPGDEIPEGWIKGKGMKWFHDPVTGKNMIFWEDEAQKNLIIGRKVNRKSK
jgi:group I intron endonuclease